MLIEEGYLKKLKDFNLNSYESKLWIALLSRGVSTAGELSDIANVPRSRSYDVLESLEKKGFVEMKLGKPIKYIAVPPSEAVERMKKDISKKKEEQLGFLNELKSSKILAELETLYLKSIEQVDPTEFSGSIKGRSNVYNHLESMIREAEDNVTIMTTGKGLLRKVERFKEILQKMKDRGVNIRIAAPLTNNEVKVIASQLKGIAEVKNVDKIKARFCVVDKKQVLIMLLNDDEVHSTSDMGVWINAPNFANSLNNMFEKQVVG